MEREDVEAIAEHPLFKCKCDACQMFVGHLAREIRAVRSEPRGQRTDLVVAGALAGALATLVDHPGSVERTREQLKVTYLRLASEAFEEFIAEVLDEKREANAIERGLH